MLEKWNIGVQQLDCSLHAILQHSRTSAFLVKNLELPILYTEVQLRTEGRPHGVADRRWQKGSAGNRKGDIS